VLPTNVIAIYANVVLFGAGLMLSYLLLRRWLHVRVVLWPASLAVGGLCLLSFHPTQAVLGELSVGLPADAHAGATPPPPSTIDPHLYKGQAFELHVPDSMRPGEIVAGSVSIHNGSDLRWPTHGDYSVKVGYRLFDESGKVVDEGRTPLYPDVAPNETRTVSLRVQAPQKPCSYQLVAGLLFEMVTWFDAAGGADARKKITVR
jgi:hypothetical protein